MQAKRRKTEKENICYMYMNIVHTAMPFRGDKNEALQSIKEIIVREKGSRENVLCYMGNDNKLTTYLLYHFTNTAAASQAKQEDFFLLIVIETWLLMKSFHDQQNFAEPMSFDVVVVMS